MGLVCGSDKTAYMTQKQGPGLIGYMLFFWSVHTGVSLSDIFGYLMCSRSFSKATKILPGQLLPLKSPKKQTNKTKTSRKFLQFFFFMYFLHNFFLTFFKLMLSMSLSF